MLGVDFDDREVGFTIRADYASAIFGRIAVHLHGDLVAIFYYVIVGNDVAVGVHDKARARGFRFLGPLRDDLGGAATALLTEEPAEQIRAVIIAVIRLTLPVAGREISLTRDFY